MRRQCTWHFSWLFPLLILILRTNCKVRDKLATTLVRLRFRHRHIHTHSHSHIPIGRNAWRKAIANSGNFLSSFHGQPSRFTHWILVHLHYYIKLNTFHITHPDASANWSVFGFFFPNCDTTKIYEISKWNGLEMDSPRPGRFLFF